ncbi:MAG: isomerase [Gammaproteobacteria bacterium]|nr:MAG: isomerase [Gammaproteobacteria bacterium]
MNKYLRAKFYTLLIILLIISGCTTMLPSVTPQAPDFETLYGPSQPKQRLISKDTDITQGAISYHKDVKPILNSRCVACHACYDAPCQLKLGSTAGVDRGATKQLVYDGGRLEAIEPTRLFIDAVNTQGWRDKEFYPVLNERVDATQAALNNSLLAKLIQLKRINPLPESGKLSDSLDLDIYRKLECPTIEEFSDHKQNHPDWGMPYAMPGLSLKQENTIMTWLQEGAKFDAQAPLSVAAIATIAQWEQFFNQPSLKQQLVSRYIYEHLFIGHIHFKGQSDQEFYHLVRSTTPPGQPVNEIATVFPYDAPGVADFYYRLRPIEATIVEKTHFVYEFSDEKMQRYKELFFQADYNVTKLPSYQPEIAANPFTVYAEIPYHLRYQFLLDDAQYFVSGFIKGPVCRGQIALSVIRDRFWIAFYKPSNTNKQTELYDFLKKQHTPLSLPGAAGENLGLLGVKKYNNYVKQYLKNKEMFANHLIRDVGSLQVEDIWDGNGINQNATLTVFRHFDSATVVKGLIGDTPLTGWIVDYPLLERVHYLLVAGYNIYDAVDHQFASRQYMDFLRIDGESNLLRFMPADQRKAIHASWYKGVTGMLADYINTPYYSAAYETGVDYQTTQYKKEFFNQLRHRLGNAAGKKDFLNQCEEEACRRKEASPLQLEIDTSMRKLAKLKGHELALLPEMSLVRVRTRQENNDPVYTLILNKSLENVAFMTGEDLRRERRLDTLTVIPGFLGSYPNFFFEVDKTQLPEFIAAIKQARSKKDKEAFYKKFGIRRTNPKIWQSVDWFNAQHKKYRRKSAGLFDLNRYLNL